MPRSRTSPILLFALLCAALFAAHAAGGDQGKADAEVRLAPAIAPQIIIAPAEVRSAIRRWRAAAGYACFRKRITRD